MKKFRKLLYVIAFAIAVMAVAFTVVACDGGESDAKYTITFMNGSSTYSTAEYSEGDEVSLPEDPSREGYVFDGWSVTEKGQVVSVVSTMPANNLVYYAQYSRCYTLTLNAGQYGTLAEDKTELTVTAGANLYSLVADIEPTPSSGLEFAAWFYGNNALRKGLSYTMPTNDLTINAKYYVGYTVNTYRQKGLNSTEYELKKEELKGYVGEAIGSIPTIDGYRYKDDKAGSSDTTKALSAVASENVFNLYYDLDEYSVKFYANLPSDVTVDGEMATEFHAHGIEYPVPECEFSADGYRFQGWATSATGAVVYRPVKGNKFAITKVTSLYAVWVEALTDASGESRDRIYIMKDEDEKDVAYLERYSLQNDIKGAYDVASGVFTFANDTTTVLRGIASISSGKYSYIDKTASVYKLMDSNGQTSNSVTLEIKADGKSAVYTKNGNTYSGSFEYVEGENSLKFTSEQESFFFRINSASGAYQNPGQAIFEIRGKEYGEWQNLLQTGYVDGSYTLFLDGYGEAAMYVYGFNDSMNGYATTGFSAYYNFTANSNEIDLYVFSSRNNTVRHELCSLREGDYTTEPDTDGNTETYKRVYIESFGQTIYAKPAENGSVDTDGDKIVLENYSVDENSAKYYQNGKIVLSGTYVYDRYSGILTITPKTGDSKQFEIDAEGEYTVFEPLEPICGQYYILGLENTFGPRGFYRFRIDNNGKASFVFLLPIYTDTFYGQVGLEYYEQFSGDYKLVTPAGEDADGNVTPAEYVFTADESYENNNAWYNVYLSYYYMFNRQAALDITNFVNFKFIFVEDEELDLTYIGVTDIGDNQSGIRISYTDDLGNENIYELDGYSYVYKVTNDVLSEEKEETVRYIYDNSVGVNRISLYVNYRLSTQKVITYINANGDGKTYERYSAEYYSGNADTTLKIIIFDNNVAMLCILYSNTFHVVSIGSVTWDGETKGTYNEQVGTYSSVSFIGLAKEYHVFDFYLRAVGDGTCFFISEASETITAADGVSTLVINEADNVATYTLKVGDKTTKYEGNCTIRGDIVKITYANEDDAGTKTLKITGSGNSKSFKEVTDIAGYWMDNADGKSYLYISGETAGEDAYSAEYYAYDDDTNNWTSTVGTVQATETEDEKPLKGYEFTSANVSFIFNVGKSSSTNMPIFGRYIGSVVGRYVYMRTPSGSFTAIGTLTGGGYSNYTFTYRATSTSNNTVTGDYVEGDAEKGTYFFVDNSSSGTYFYFVEEDVTYVDEDGETKTQTVLFLRDGMFTDPNYGVFELHLGSETKVTLSYSEGDEKQVTVEKIVMSGTYKATLHYDDNGTKGTVEGNYIAYTSGLYLFYGIDDNDGEVGFWFKIYTTGDDKGTLCVRIMDNEKINAYVGADNSVVYFDGYETALYIDSYGRVFYANFKTVGTVDGKEVIAVTYTDRSIYTPNPGNNGGSFGGKTIHVKIDPETHTFIAVDWSNNDGQE
ncbi:MAG: hypothetical protein HDT28_03275 [Clostridiales bacterium]|nr:hypothetical protein [Clostridiales bacterium]